MLEQDERVQKIARELIAQGVKLPYAIPRPRVPAYEPQRIPERSWPLHRILIAVSNHTGISPLRMKSTRRGRNDEGVTRARWLYFWVARTLTSFSFPHIGTLTGDTNHSTVMHAIRCIKADWPAWQDDIQTIQKTLEET